MNTFSSLRFASLAAAIACTGLVSCYNTPDTKKAAKRIELQPSSVYSHNDQTTAANRQCVKVGDLPARARRALTAWMYHSEVKQFSYVYPQYYISVGNTAPAAPSVWAVCTDAKGNLVGILVPRNNTPAWNLNNLGNYDVYVCQGKKREELSRAILESLADARMDKHRISTRRSIGLKPASLISAPEPIAAPVSTTRKAAPASKPATAKAAEPETSADDTPADEPAADAPADTSSSDDSFDSAGSGSDDGFGI